jgi:hypothetical protein
MSNGFYLSPNAFKSYFNPDAFYLGEPEPDWDEELRKNIKEANELNLENVTLED